MFGGLFLFALLFVFVVCECVCVCMCLCVRVLLYDLVDVLSNSSLRVSVLSFVCTCVLCLFVCLYCCVQNVIQSIAEAVTCPSLTYFDITATKLQPEAYVSLAKALPKSKVSDEESTRITYCSYLNLRTCICSLVVASYMCCVQLLLGLVVRSLLTKVSGIFVEFCCLICFVTSCYR